MSTYRPKVAYDEQYFDAIGDVTTDTRFWDCECEENYINLKAEQTECTLCGAKDEDQPDSRVNEIMNMGLYFSQLPSPETRAQWRFPQFYPEAVPAKWTKCGFSAVKVVQILPEGNVVVEKCHNDDPNMMKFFSVYLRDDEGEYCIADVEDIDQAARLQALIKNVG